MEKILLDSETSMVVLNKAIKENITPAQALEKIAKDFMSYLEANQED